MKEFKTFNQQLEILRNRGLIVPKNGRPKRFLEQENYYNVINGYKDLFLQKDSTGRLINPEQYLPNTHFNELQALFLFDRELRMVFLKYILVFENSFKTTFAHEFSKKYSRQNSYLEIQNYVSNQPKKVLKQISILTQTIHNKVAEQGAIKHYIERHNSVPLWVLVNYLTIGNLSHLYEILKDADKNTIAKRYYDKYSKQYTANDVPRFAIEDLESALKIINLVRNKCAHDERLYNSSFNSVRISRFANYFRCHRLNNERLVVTILYLKILLDKKYFQKFHTELKGIFDRYQNKFITVDFDSILNIMGIEMTDFENLR